MKNKEPNKSKNLYEIFSEIEDFRRPQGRMHSLATILTIITMALMSGYNGIRAIGDFIVKHRKELIKTIKPKKNKLPSRQTIGRVIQNVKFETLTKSFSKWANNYVRIKEKDWVSLDGKVIGGTVTNSQNQFQKYINLVSVFLNKKKQVLSAGEVGSDKKSEIPVVKQLIDELDLEGVVFTIDALHCQKETTKTIVKNRNDYVIGVKGNQKKLYEQIKKTPKSVKK